MNFYLQTPKHLINQILYFFFRQPLYFHQLPQICAHKWHYQITGEKNIIGAMTINDDIQVILQSMDLSTNMNLQVLESVQREVSCEHIYQTDHLC